MKITHICQFLGVGGLEKVLFNLISEQLKVGHEVDLIVYDYDRRWVSKFSELDIKIHTDYLKKDGYDIQLLQYLYRKTKHSQIIHTHDLNPMLYMGVIRLIKFIILKKTLLIHTTHGMEHIETHPKTRWYEIFLGIMAKKIITVSPKFKNYYVNQFFTKNSKVKLVNNGTLIDNTLPATPQVSIKNEICCEFNLNPNQSLGIYVARVVPLKGQKELLLSLIDSDKQLLIVGPSGNDAYFNDCKFICNKNIVMTDNRDDIQRLLSGCDYFISASLHEGLPIAVIEAGAAGLPCILSSIPGHTTFNTSSECVEIFNDFKNIEDMINNLLLNKDTYIQNFFQLIKDKYSAKKMTQEYLSIYGECQ